jgi:hypothetical protein
MCQVARTQQPAHMRPNNPCELKSGVRLVVVFVLAGFGFGLGLVKGAVRMLGRSVNRVQLERLCCRGVDDVMLCASRDDDR